MMLQYVRILSSINGYAYQVKKQVHYYIPDMHVGNFVKIRSIDLKRVFDKFYRVQRDKHNGNYPTGTRLGLAICKGIVEAHGGRI